MTKPLCHLPTMRAERYDNGVHQIDRPARDFVHGLENLGGTLVPAKSPVFHHVLQCMRHAPLETNWVPSNESLVTNIIGSIVHLAFLCIRSATETTLYGNRVT